MKIDADPTWKAKLDSSARNSVSVNDKRIIDGSSEPLIAPIMSGVDDESMISILEDLLSKVHLTSYLRKVEDDNRSKIGPRSIASPWVDRKSSLAAYFQHNDYDPGEFLEVGVGGFLRPVSLDTASNSLVRSSSAGLPYMRRKGAVMDRAIQDFTSDVGAYPCILYTRTQEQGKTRNVWGYPVSDTLAEQQYFLPWLTHEKKLPWRKALEGPTAVDAAVSLMLSSKRPVDVVQTVDFSQFDATVTPENAYTAFRTISKSFQSSARAGLYRNFRRFVTIPILTPEGQWSGPHGVPSGSSWTNTIDSLVQYAAAIDGLGYQDRPESFDLGQIQGDDGIYLVRKSEQSDFLKSFSDLGLTLNEDKSDAFETTEGMFLQRYYHSDYPNRYGHGLGGVYSIYRAANRLKYLERWTDFDQLGIEGSDFFSLRAIMILENCKHHPAFEEFVKTVQGWDRDSLSFSQQGLHAFSKAMQSRLRAGVSDHEDFAEGINSFETMKVLRR